MQAGNVSNTGVFGLYELSNEGTILYSRPRGDEGLHESAAEFIGRDFFNDIFTCANIDDLRRHFRKFITGDRSVDSFVFDCFYDDEVVPTKIFMTRAYETNYDHINGIVIMDVRRARQ